jgi:hypothetical protein
VLVDPPPDSLFTGRSPNTRQLANFYPTLNMIAIGEQLGKFPTHRSVHKGFLAEMAKTPLFVSEVPSGTAIRAFPLGKDVIIPINDHELLLKEVTKADPSPKAVDSLNQILEVYRQAVSDAAKIVEKTGGRIIATIDSVPQSLTYSLISDGKLAAPLLASESGDLLPLVNGHVDRKKYFVRIEALADNCTRELIQNQVKRYEEAIQIATARALEVGGEVLLQADGESQKLIAKLLNRLHQVDDPLKSGAECIRNTTKELTSELTSGRCIKNPNTGTRFYFPDDLQEIAKGAIVSIPPHLSEAEREKFIADHYSRFKATIGELAEFLNELNRMGNREGQFFLVDKAVQTVNNNPATHSRFAELISDVYVSVRSSTDWLEDQFRVSTELCDIVKELKKHSHPDFHAINLSSPRFVELVNRALRSESSKIDFGDDFSTPLNAKEFGGFQNDRRGRRQFVVTSTDPQLRALAKWQFSSKGLRTLSTGPDSSQIVNAAYVSAYQTGSDRLTFEPHPTNFVRRFGHLEAKFSFVVEFGIGQPGQTPERWVIEDNVWAPARLLERNTQTIAKLLDELHPFDLSTFIKEFKDAQYELFSAVLSAMRGSSATLAPPYQWVTIEGMIPGQEVNDQFENCRVRPFINGTRADKIQFHEWDFVRLGPTMKILGDLMAAGIIAQLPHLPLRDMILSKAPGKKEIRGITFLSPGESFCHSAKAKTLKEYLKEIVPTLYGNRIAGWLAPIGYLERSGEDAAWRKTQEVLVDCCVSQIQNRLQEISKGKNSGGVRIRQLLKDKMDSVASRHNKHTKEGRPEELKIGNFTPLSIKLLSLNKSQIRSICNSIKETAIRELRLIEKIAPAPPKGSTVEKWKDVDDCARAVSSLIEGHLSGPKRRGEALHGLKTLIKDLHLLSVTERSAYISLLNVNMRIAELGKKTELGNVFADAFHHAADEVQFYEFLVEKAPSIDLEYGTISACYRAIGSFRTSFKKLENNDPKRAQLSKALKSLRPLGKLITDR